MDTSEMADFIRVNDMTRDRAVVQILDFLFIQYSRGRFSRGDLWLMLQELVILVVTNWEYKGE